MAQSFGKKEKLKSRKLIGQLFDEGKSVVKFPVKMLYLPKESLEVNKAAFAVPKRSFTLAVHRNRIKRQLREAYRLQKDVVDTKNGKKFVLLFLYISKDKPQYDQLTSSMATLLKNISK
jgi:ribonuclease P protein component